MPRRLFIGCIALIALIALVSAAFAPSPPDDITPPLSVQWVFSMGADPMNVARPVIQNDRVYVSHKGILHCLDNVTGAEKWKFEPENAAVTTGPVPWKNLIIVGATDATVYGLDANTGDPVWERICASTIAPDPLLLDGMLLVGAGQMVYALSPETGDASWICSLTSTAKSGPFSDGSMAYFLCQDGTVQCVDASQGRYRWTSRLRTGPRTFRPLVASQRVIVASGNRVYGVARSGAIAWTAEMSAGVGGAPTLVDDLLYVPCVDGRIYLLYARSGAPRHSIEYQVDHSLTAPPAVTETVVAAGSANALVYVFERASGEVKWIYRCREPDRVANEGAEHGLYAPMIVADGSLYCLTGGGDLYRLAASAPDPAGPVFGDLNPEPGSALPGGQYVGAICSITDDGTGVDPASVTGSIDGTPLPVTFDPVSGLATLRASIVPDGSHIVKLSARDYRGHETTAEWGFLTDVSIVSAPGLTGPGAARAGTRGGGGRGGGGRGGGGGGGGGRRGGGGGRGGGRRGT
ncbi:MAG TPA: PQQ-binding-like beta-propeller repeat protein [Armatimonadota bacterium]|nr:PQQ-binding-like beta-propeller repeat protein [Armatimonadota bacterium]